MHLLLFAETIQLFPDGTLFIHIAIILAMIWILNRTLFRPINRVIESREKNKGGHSSDAVAILKDIEIKEAKYAQEMLDARSRGYELIEKEQKKATAAREQKIANAQAEVAGKFEAGKAELEQEAAQTHSAIGADAEKIADRIAANILKG
jgi:F-type H+-transporting ATPase subunit b